MKEEDFTENMFDKKYGSSLNYSAMLGNHNIKSADPGQKLIPTNSAKVIRIRKRWDACSCTPDQNMSVLPVPLIDTSVLMTRCQKKAKGKEGGDLSINLCSGKLGLGLETENLVITGTHKFKGNNQGEKNSKSSKDANKVGSLEGASSTKNGSVGKGISEFSKEGDKAELIPISLNAPVQGHGGKKLLVLDLNGLLVDIRQETSVGKKADFRVNGKPAFKRPFCDDFLRFCFENFKIGIWSSRKRENIDKVVNILMKDWKHEILFCWDQPKCTETGCRSLENFHKKLLLKDLRKIWEKSDPSLPFEKGEYSSSNTLLIDDSPYKALCNPPHTAIFPIPYSIEDSEDNTLGPGGKLRCYLEGLVKADDVQCYVRDNPFGQPPISDGHRYWDFYSKILENVAKFTKINPL